MNIRKYFLQFVILVFIAISAIANAQEQYVADDFKVTLKPMGQYAVISFELERGAKFYWRNPGELGLPTKFDFKKSKNLKEAQVFWPVPVLYERDNISSYIYKDNTDFIVKLTPNDINHEVKINADISFSVCRRGCHNHKIHLSSITKITDLDAVPGVILEVLNNMPHKNGEENFTITKVEQEIIDAQHWLNIEFTNEETLLDPKLFLDLPEYVTFQPADFNLISSEETQIFRIPFSINDKKHNEIEDEIYINIVADNEDTVELSIVPVLQDAAQNNSHFIWILFCAFLGGVILNIMPCVLPILAIKLLQLIELGKKDAAIVKRSLIAQSSGIIFTFISFGLLTYILQFLGYQAGLGVHFQQPFYLITMILILSFIAINILAKEGGAIHTPQAILQVFHSNSQKAGIFGFFASGILTTLLAIPCTAPFVTIAVGFALTTDLLRMLAVFGIMGVGMSLPYIVMVITPNIIKLLPKSGPWTIKFKKILGVAIIATSIWLIYVVSTQLGFKAGITLFLLMLLIKFVFTENKILIGKAKIFVLAILIFLAYFLPHNLYVEKQRHETLVESVWIKYNPEDISTLIEEGYVVVVNVTASWCSTCGLNNVTTLENTAVINSTNKLKIITMKADISKETSEDVANLMREKKHYGIPFTLVYSKKYPNGKALPTILTPQGFVSEIKSAF